MPPLVFSLRGFIADYFIKRESLANKGLELEKALREKVVQAILINGYPSNYINN
jgi:hypothetical protein